MEPLRRVLSCRKQTQWTEGWLLESLCTVAVPVCRKCLRLKQEEENVSEPQPLAQSTEIQKNKSASFPLPESWVSEELSFPVLTV